MSQKPHLSVTRLEMYARCGEQYRRRYVEGEIIPPGVALAVGRGVHGGAEENFRQKVESHRDLPPQQIVDAAVASFEQTIKEGVQLTPQEEAAGQKKVLGQAKDQVVQLAELHAQEQAPDYQPVEVEQPYRLELSGASHDLLMVPDLVDDQQRVVDIKTRSRRYRQEDADQSLQLTAYAAGFHRRHGHPPRELRLDALVKNKKPVRQVVKTARGELDYQALAARINAMLAGLDKGIFMPAEVGHWCCSPTWCGYWNTCPYVNSARQEAARRNGYE